MRKNDKNVIFKEQYTTIFEVMFKLLYFELQIIQLTKNAVYSKSPRERIYTK